jgi:NADH dehydrogenase FAD-containing subunit
MSRVVAVIGGGYGGAAVAKALDAEADVVLIEPRDAFVNSAGSLRALAQPVWAPTMLFPYDTLLARGTVIHDRLRHTHKELADAERLLIVDRGESAPARIAPRCRPAADAAS